MDKQSQKEYLEKITAMSDEEKRHRDLYLKKMANGELEGPPIGLMEFDKPWLTKYSDEAILEEVPRMNIYNYIKACNKDRLDLVALNYYGRKITYREMFEEVDKVICALKAKGIKPYDGKSEQQVVSIALPNVPETFYTFLAVNAMGAVANFIDPRINEERIEKCLADANSSLLISIDTFNDKFDNVTKKNGMSDKVITVSPSDSLPPVLKSLYKLKVKTSKKPHFEKWKDFVSNGKRENPDVSEVVFYPELEAAIEYTSGTTGIPKGAVLSNGNIVGVAYQETKALPEIFPGDKFLNIMPPFIAYGLACGVCTSLTEGLELILIPKFDPKDFADLVLKHKPNHIIGVPSFFEALVKNEKVQKEDLSYIKYCIAGGDKMNIESEKKINEFFEQHGIKNRIIKGYGMTELSSVIAVNLDNNSNKLGSTGIVLHKNNIKVLDPDTGERKGVNESGEIYILSPTKMSRYLNNETEMQNVFKKDEAGNIWVKTGDCGRVDEEGNIFIEDRYKNMIVRPDGHNVFPTPIENVICSHEAVEACVVVGIESEEYDNGQIPTACVVIKPEFRYQEKEIIEQINDLSLVKLPPRDIALSYKVIDSIPMTPVGKIDTKALKNMIIDQEKNKQRVK